jgi:hypothetical protein
MAEQIWTVFERLNMMLLLMSKKLAESIQILTLGVPCILITGIG